MRAEEAEQAVIGGALWAGCRRERDDLLGPWRLRRCRWVGRRLQGRHRCGGCGRSRRVHPLLLGVPSAEAV